MREKQESNEMEGRRHTTWRGKEVWTAGRAREEESSIAAASGAWAKGMAKQLEKHSVRYNSNG